MLTIIPAIKSLASRFEVKACLAGAALSAVQIVEELLK
jgi:hypothetical protein